MFAGDNTTPIPSATVLLQSSDPIYARTYYGQADGNGVYSFQGSLGGMAVPAENFTVLSYEPTTSTVLTPQCAQYGTYSNNGCAIISPPSTGSFVAGAASASADIFFSNTGIITGTISRGPTVLNVAGTVTLSGGPMNNVTVPIQADGTYKFLGVLPGSYVVEAFVSNTLLTGLANSTVVAGQTTTTNVTIIDSGNITGAVTRGDQSLAINDIVNLRVPNQNPLQVVVDTSGHYAFTDIPVGTYSIDVYDGVTKHRSGRDRDGCGGLHDDAGPRAAECRQCQWHGLRLRRKLAREHRRDPDQYDQQWYPDAQHHDQLQRRL